MKKTLFITSVLITLILLADLFWWYYVADDNLGIEQSVTKYLAVFPNFLASVGILTLLELLFGAFVLAITGYFVAKKIYFILSLILLILNAFIFYLHLFSLM
jgi:hypothetical protein